MKLPSRGAHAMFQTPLGGLQYEVIESSSHHSSARPGGERSNVVLRDLKFEVAD
jgi:hypothetical protein